MASTQDTLFVLVFFTIIPFLLFCVGPSNAAQAERVTLAVYYETLCPYCSSFISRDLTRVFTDGFLPIVNLRLVPWGNAALGPTGSFQCQHGDAECLLNTVEACTISTYPDVGRHFPFIQCIENLSYQQRQSQWQDCFAAASLDPQPVVDCYNNGHGRQIELQYAYETAQLHPAHEYVPWVTVNDKPLKEYYKSFVEYVCNAYKGGDIPTACSSSQQGVFTYEMEEVDSSHQVCYAGNPTNISSYASAGNLP